MWLVGIDLHRHNLVFAAVHDSAAAADETDWREILMLYELLEATAPGPMVALNRIVAVAMVHGADAGLAQLDDVDPSLYEHHRLAAVRAHLLDLSGDKTAAREAYELAAQLTQSLPEQRYLLSRANSASDPS